MQLSLLANRSPATAQQIEGFVKFCDGQGPTTVKIEAQGEGFRLHQVSGTRELAVNFSWIGGSTFVRNFDPAKYLEFLGLDGEGEEQYADMRAQALARVPQRANVYRPAEDILVIEGSGQADIYGRCPQ